LDPCCPINKHEFIRLSSFEEGKLFRQVAQKNARSIQDNQNVDTPWDSSTTGPPSKQASFPFISLYNFSFLLSLAPHIIMEHDDDRSSSSSGSDNERGGKGLRVVGKNPELGKNPESVKIQIEFSMSSLHLCCTPPDSLMDPSTQERRAYILKECPGYIFGPTSSFASSGNGDLPNPTFPSK